MRCSVDFAALLPAGWTPECNVGHATWLEAGAEPVLESPVVLMRIQGRQGVACDTVELDCCCRSPSMSISVNRGTFPLAWLSGLSGSHFQKGR
ncbi:hypothetical protein WJX82_005501 [Trebouxia sp. C0006]